MKTFPTPVRLAACTSEMTADGRLFLSYVRPHGLISHQTTVYEWHNEQWTKHIVPMAFMQGWPFSVPTDEICCRMRPPSKLFGVEAASYRLKKPDITFKYWDMISTVEGELNFVTGAVNARRRTVTRILDDLQIRVTPYGLVLKEVRGIGRGTDVECGSVSFFVSKFDWSEYQKIESLDFDLAYSLNHPPDAEVFNSNEPDKFFQWGENEYSDSHNFHNRLIVSVPSGSTLPPKNIVIPLEMSPNRKLVHGVCIGNWVIALTGTLSSNCGNRLRFYHRKEDKCFVSHDMKLPSDCYAISLSQDRSILTAIGYSKITQIDLDIS